MRYVQLIYACKNRNVTRFIRLQELTVSPLTETSIN